MVSLWMMVSPWKSALRAYGLALALSIASIPAFAQDSPAQDSSTNGDPASAAPADPIQPAQTQSPDSPSSPGGPDKRVFGVLPNYRTVDGTGPYQAITAKQKLTIATKDTVDYPLFLVGAGFAGLAQLSDQHRNFGEGMKGFSLRYVTAYSDQAMGNLMTEGFLPILFHEDPRYFRVGPSYGGVWKRTGYAASRIFWNKTDKGVDSFNFAEVIGNSMSAGLGNAYYTQERTLGDNFQRLYVALATDAFSQVLKEFWPDIKQKFFHRQKPQ
jgi:hypothetical protein